MEDFESRSRCKMGKLRITNAICFPSRGQRRLGFWDVDVDGMGMGAGGGGVTVPDSACSEARELARWTACWLSTAWSRRENKVAEQRGSLTVGVPRFDDALTSGAGGGLGLAQCAN